MNFFTPQRQLLWLAAFFGSVGCAALWLMLTGCNEQERAEMPPLVALVDTHGTSMLPAFKENGQVLVCLFDSYDKLKVGDVVIYRHGSGYIMHRLVARQFDWWIARGDNNTFADAPMVTRENYLGRVVTP